YSAAVPTVHTISAATKKAGAHLDFIPICPQGPPCARESIRRLEAARVGIFLLRPASYSLL
ncbi:MAG: hypothetical protein ACRDQZ_07340, partial [Mycobacteriales bacterium]